MLKILTHPNEILSRKADLVSFPLDNSTKSLIKEMWQTVRTQGVGLAAPQVGVSTQICIIHLSEHNKSRDRNLDFVMINPKITFLSEVKNLMVEGCLSFPEQYFEIWRPANIIAEFYNEKGKKTTIRAKDWLSRVIQHEVDHLNGNLFINKGGKQIDSEEISSKNIVD